MAFIGLDFSFDGDHPDARGFWEDSINGFHNEEIGQSDTAPGWFCVFYMDGVILREDTQGFLHMAEFATREETEIAWQQIERLVESYELS